MGVSGQFHDSVAFPAATYWLEGWISPRSPRAGLDINAEKSKILNLLLFTLLFIVMPLSLVLDVQSRKT
jgi:hypothetical protein